VQGKLYHFDILVYWPRVCSISVLRPRYVIAIVVKYQLRNGSLDCRKRHDGSLHIQRNRDVMPYKCRPVIRNRSEGCELLICSHLTCLRSFMTMHGTPERRQAARIGSSEARAVSISRVLWSFHECLSSSWCPVLLILDWFSSSSCNRRGWITLR
jgi:hypothetical protein